MDYYWSCNNATTLEVRIFFCTDIWLQKKEADITSLSDRDRIEYSCQKQDYSFLNYLAYVLYSPLYLAGPIITFNYYISQVQPNVIYAHDSCDIQYGQSPHEEQFFMDYDLSSPC